MPFVKGHSMGKGRPPGAPNKEVKSLRESINTILEGGVDTFMATMEELRKTNPKAYVDNYIKLMEYSLPKMRSVDNTIKVDEGVSGIKIEIKPPAISDDDLYFKNK
jgi:hypothetical protein